jgi:hypothetical protein
VRLLADLGEEEQGVEKLIRMGPAYEEHRSFSGDVECAAGSAREVSAEPRWEISLDDVQCMDME